jgi:3-oxoacyl-[acyl-carrier protein] reductase
LHCLLEDQEGNVANAGVSLASDKAKYITGIALNVSGGIELFTLRL